MRFRLNNFKCLRAPKCKKMAFCVPGEAGISLQYCWRHADKETKEILQAMVASWFPQN